MARSKVTEAIKPGEHLFIPVAVRLFVCTDHDGFNVPSSHRASVIVARDDMHARELLDKALVKHGLLGYGRSKYKLQEISLDRYTAEVLADGSY